MTGLSILLAVIGSGVMAGIYFAFSTFVMKSLAAIPREQGIAAMQSINQQILSSPFMPLFFATTALSLGLAVIGAVRWGDSGSAMLVIAGLVYVIGMFVCTAAFNVPLNDALDAVDPGAPEAADVWASYLRDWTLYNHVRTVACVASTGFFLAALMSA